MDIVESEEREVFVNMFGDSLVVNVRKTKSMLLKKEKFGRLKVKLEC